MSEHDKPCEKLYMDERDHRVLEILQAELSRLAHNQTALCEFILDRHAYFKGRFGTTPSKGERLAMNRLFYDPYRTNFTVCVTKPITQSDFNIGQFEYALRDGDIVSYKANGEPVRTNYEGKIKVTLNDANSILDIDLEFDNNKRLAKRDPTNEVGGQTVIIHALSLNLDGSKVARGVNFRNTIVPIGPEQQTTLEHCGDHVYDRNVFLSGYLDVLENEPGNDPTLQLYLRLRDGSPPKSK